MTIGDKLKKVRFSLGLSQTEMADGIINRSFYSRIESGQNNINASDLLQILRVHQIPLLTFLEDFGDVKPKNQYYRNQVIDNYFNKDVVALKKISQSPNIVNAKLKQVTDLLIAKLEGKLNEFPASTIRKLKYNVFQSGYWDEDSLWILLNSMNLYNFSDLQGLVDSVINRFADYKENNEEILQLLASIAVNYLEICFEKVQSDHEIKRTIHFLKNLPSSSTIVLQKMIGSCFEAKYKRNNKKLKNSVSLLITLGYGNYIPKKLVEEGH